MKANKLEESDIELEKIKPIDEPTENIPKYIHEGLEKQSAASLEDIIAYSLNLLAEEKKPLDKKSILNSKNNIESVEEVKQDEIDDDAWNEVNKKADGNVWGITRKIMCNKSNCACHTRNDLHGPYRYYVYRSDGSLKWKYIGKA